MSVAPTHPHFNHRPHQILKLLRECVFVAEEDKWNQLPNGQYTTAPVHSNTYIPQTAPLPLTKPCGARHVICSTCATKSY